MCIIAAKPARFCKAYHCHLPGIAVFDSREDLHKNARAYIIFVVVDREVASTREDIVGTGNLLTDHERVLPLFDLDIVDVEILLFQGTKGIAQEALPCK